MLQLTTQIFPSHPMICGGGGEDRKHAIEAAAAMAEIDRHKADVKKSNVFSAKRAQEGFNRRSYCCS